MRKNSSIDWGGLVYNPAKLDTDQWMEAAKAMGAKYCVFVAKHCSGFLQWQSDLYEYGWQPTGTGEREAPHKVRFANDYYLGVFEVTQAQWSKVYKKGNNSSFKNTDCNETRPVETVGYWQIRGSATSGVSVWTPANGIDLKSDSFLGVLRARTGAAFDLPTESQWEFAAHGGTDEMFYNGKTYFTCTDPGTGKTDGTLLAAVQANLSRLGRWSGNGGVVDGMPDTRNASSDFSSYTAESGTARVGSYLPNGYGLYDMLGNVRETCREMGAKWDRHIFRSDTVTPDSEKFPETPNESCLRQPRTDDPFFCFCYTPPWLNGHRDEPQGYRWAPTDMEKYADWVSYITKANMKYGYRNYEIWNEPVPYAGWMGSVESLIETTKATWKGVKRVQPDAKILGPCPYSFCPEFVEEFFAKGGAKWIDDVVIHAYHAAPPDGEFIDGVRNTKRLMAKYGLAGRKLYITEVGYDAPGTEVHDIAAFLPRIYAYALSEGVSALIWHMGQALSHEGLNESTLLKKDCSPNPAFAAYCARTARACGCSGTRRRSAARPARPTPGAARSPSRSST